MFATQPNSCSSTHAWLRLRQIRLPFASVSGFLDRCDHAVPDDCSLEDVQYHLYVVRALEEGEVDEAAGRVIPHEQVAAELRRKWLLGHAT